MTCILNKIFPERCNFEPSEKFRMSSLVLIEMAITFDILKTYTGFGLLLPIMNCSFRLNRLELPFRLHFCANSLYFKPIFDSRPVVIF